MSNQNQYLKIHQLLDILESNYPGTADEIAEKLDISRRTLFRYLEELRDRGAIIEYCKCQRTYSLENDFDFFEVFFKSAL
jgi:predicted DNA-binding transcriptional regulator YafY